MILYSWRYTDADHPAVFAFTNGGSRRTARPTSRSPAPATKPSTSCRCPSSSSQRAPPTYHRLPASCGEPERSLSSRRSPGAPRAQLARARTNSPPPCRPTASTVVRTTSPAESPSTCSSATTAQAKRVAVFVDADRAAHRPPDTPERVDQHAVLERAGWTVVRVPATRALPTIADVGGGHQERARLQPAPARCR